MMTGIAPMPNLPLLRKVLDHIDTYPERWDQGVWFRGKFGWVEAACTAGRAALLSGDVVHPDSSGCVMALDGHVQDVASRARDLLGLTQDEADRLFNGENTLDDIQRVAEIIAARAGEQL